MKAESEVSIVRASNIKRHCFVEYWPWVRLIDKEQGKEDHGLGGSWLRHC
jgi:hypothetical protein